MRVTRIAINDFRAFKGNRLDIELGQGITCIAGYNGVGKSTILAVLSNCGELKKQDGSHLNGEKLSGDYSELIKFDEDSDTAGTKAVLWFEASEKGETLEIDKLEFRASIQSANKRTAPADDPDDENGHDGTSTQTNTSKVKKPSPRPMRYRLIPRKTTERDTESKLKWPTYYLGLSRLYPVGESSTVSRTQLHLTDDEMDEFKVSYQQIMSFDETIQESQKLKLSEAPRKTGSGIRTSTYGPLANSAGQDNLGQILLTLLSFKRLKEDLGPAYNGGLILIDELDATLHPSAQVRLYRKIRQYAKDLHLQVVFTTHSFHLIEQFSVIEQLTPKNRWAKLILSLIHI